MFTPVDLVPHSAPAQEPVDTMHRSAWQHLDIIAITASSFHRARLPSITPPARIFYAFATDAAYDDSIGTVQHT